MNIYIYTKNLSFDRSICLSIYRLQVCMNECMHVCVVTLCHQYIVSCVSFIFSEASNQPSSRQISSAAEVSMNDNGELGT